MEWRRCGNDVVYFLEKYAYIRHPSRGRILFELRDAQKRGLDHWMRERYSLTLKARQIGWSTLVAGYQFWLAFFHDDKIILDISKGEREAKQLLDKSKYIYKYLPDWMRSRGPRKTIDTNEELGFDNESKIASRPSASDPARGESATLVVVDEWAFLPNAEDAWASIEPVADVGGRIVGLSTANGWGEFFHTLWVGAKAGANDFKTIFEPWSANTDRDEEWYESKKRSLTSWQLAQEYPDNEDEAFVRSGRMVFDIELLRGFDPEEPQRGAVEWDQVRGYRFVEDPEGPLRVWRRPQVGEVYSLGADVAEGLDHGDYSSAHVVRQSDGMVVAHWHGHVDPDLFGAEVLNHLGRWYGQCLEVPEANNHGLTTVTALRRVKYPRIFRRRALNDIKKRQGIQLGWSTNLATKPMLIDDLVAALRDGVIDLRCVETIAELRTFTRDEKGRMSGSPFDDRVISLGLAVQGLKYVFAPEYRVEVDDYGTAAWWLRQATGVKKDARQPRIGAHSIRKTAA